MLDINKTLKKESKLTNNLTHKVFDTLDRSVVVLEVTLTREVNGKSRPCVIEKSFQNNYDGREALEKTAKEYDTEEKVKAYFGLN